MTKCAITDNELTACPAMEELLPAEVNTMGKGFSVVHVSNFKTGESRFVGITYRPVAKSGGILLNLCPFCGVEYQQDWR